MSQHPGHRLRLSEYGRRRAEVLVDTVTFIVCGAVGLDTSGSSVPYVAGWGESGELDAIRGYAGTIDEIARRIEESLRSETHSSSLRWQRSDPDRLRGPGYPSPSRPNLTTIRSRPKQPTADLRYRIGRSQE